MLVNGALMHPRDYCAKVGLPFIEFDNPQLDIVYDTPLMDQPQAMLIGRPYVFCANLQDVIVHGLESTTITPSNEILLEHLVSWHYDLSGVLKPITLSRSERTYTLEFADPVQRIDTHCVYTGGSPAPNFGHLFWQGLSRLAVASKSRELRELPVAVPDNLPSRWYELYDLLGYPRERRILFSLDPPTRFTNVWMPSIPFYRGNFSDGIPYIWNEAVWFMRDRILPKRKVDSRVGRPRVFIGRQDATHRRLANHDVVWDLLKDHGFMDFRPATVSMAEQLSTFGSAEIIVLAGGASAVAPLLAQADCPIIELQPKGQLGFMGGVPMYTLITRQRLKRIFGEPVFLPDNPSREKAKTDPLHLRDRDYFVPVDQLRDAVKVAVDMVTSRNPLDIKSVVPAGMRSLVKFK